MQPDPRVAKEFNICDPACGTSGFLMVAYEWLMQITKGALDRKNVARIKKKPTTDRSWFPVHGDLR